MRHLNEEIIREFGGFSIKGLEAILRDPETYLSITIADFLESKGTVRQTWWRLFDPGYSLTGFSLIFIPTCHYRRIKEIEDPYRIVATAQVDYVINAVRKGEMGPYNWGEINREVLNSVKNGELYDTTGALPLFTEEDIPDGTKMYHVMFSYHPPADFPKLFYYSLHDQQIKSTRISPLNELLTLISLKPAMT